jgi:glucokinase
MMSNDLILGIDIGGSHITAGLVDMDIRKVKPGSTIRKKVNCKAPAEDILSVWADTIHEITRLCPNTFSKLGFAMPGPFDYEAGVCLIKGFDKYESLYGINIRTSMAERLDIVPGDILFRNDAEAFLEGEIFCGAAASFKHAIGITLGTGLGSAVSHNGITRDAALSVLEYNGEKIEEWVSTRGLIRIYQDMTGKKVHDALTIAELYHSDAKAKDAFKIFAHRLSWFLQKFIIQESPEVLVIGGNIANSYELFIGELEKHLAINGIRLPKIFRATLGEYAALIGGACKFMSAQNNKASGVTL